MTDTSSQAEAHAPGAHTPSKGPSPELLFFGTIALFLVVVIGAVLVFGLPALGVIAVALVPVIFVALLMLTVGR